ncbi:MAG: ribonuclease III [Endomicrobiales bacterium]|jgi:ribonuclease-3|nr:ribonuclease III [Endomicrobiales bacterium]
MLNNFSKLEKTISYKFKSKKLLEKSLTHKSYASENNSDEFNERLEFLGDSILGACVAEFLYNKFPNEAEGRLSQLKSYIVSGQGLTRWAKAINLEIYLLLGTAEDANGGRKRDSILSDAFEALVAAIYIDSGFTQAKKFIHGFLNKQKRLVVRDSKSKLQEHTQSHHQTLPRYAVLNESGSDHEKIFEVGVYIKETLVAKGSGRSKKEAEQSAARFALRAINKIKNSVAKK